VFDIIKEGMPCSISRAWWMLFAEVVTSGVLLVYWSVLFRRDGRGFFTVSVGRRFLASGVSTGSGREAEVFVTAPDNHLGGPALLSLFVRPGAGLEATDDANSLALVEAVFVKQSFIPRAPANEDVVFGSFETFPFCLRPEGLVGSHTDGSDGFACLGVAEVCVLSEVSFEEYFVESHIVLLLV
jgi:hypothetical protein